MMNTIHNSTRSVKPHKELSESVLPASTASYSLRLCTTNSIMLESGTEGVGRAEGGRKRRQR